MKKLINLIALVMLVSTNVLTPFSYAEVENPEIIPENEMENVDETEEIPEISEETLEVNPEEKGEIEQENAENIAPENVLPDAGDGIETPTTQETEKVDTVSNEGDEIVQSMEENFEVEVQDENLEGGEFEDENMDENLELEQLQDPVIMETNSGNSATLLLGQEFNVKLKKLSGQSSATYSTTNTTIKQIIQWSGDVPAGVTTGIISTTDSENEIIAWYDDGTIYYYTEAETIYMNSDSSYMFYYMQGLTGLDLSSWDSSNVVLMTCMFERCSNLVKLDLSNWDTSNVKNMASMFNNCTELETVYATTLFVTNQVTNFYNTFYNIKKLVGGNGSRFDKIGGTYAKIDIEGQTGYFTDKNAITVRFLSDDIVHENQMVAFGESAIKPSIDPTKQGAVFNKWVDYNGYEYEFENSKIEKYTEIYATFNSNDAMLKPGQEFNVAVKKLAGQTSATYSTSNTTIQQIIQWSGDTIPSGVTTGLISATYSDNDVIAWFDDGTIYYYTEAETIYMNSDSSYMFYYMQGLTSLDLSSWDSSKITNMGYMFNGCSKLETVYVSAGFVTDKVVNSSSMFVGASKLVGGNGTKYDSTKTDKTYAKIDIEGQIGYFTDKNAIKIRFLSDDIVHENQMVAFGESAIKPSIDPTKQGAVFNKWVNHNGYEYEFENSKIEKYTEIYARFHSDEAVLLPGQQFNAAVKKLAGTNSYDAWNTNIKQIIQTGSISDGVKTGVISVPYSDNDVVVWYQSGIVYYYTDAETIYLNPDSSYMFYRFGGLTGLNVTNWDTSKVTDMKSMFYECDELESIDVSGWDTSNVIDMSSMFLNCESLTEIDVSNWNVSKVMNMYYMFGFCKKLTSLDLSKWDTRNVMDMSFMFRGCFDLADLNLNGLNTSKVTTMRYMFDACTSLTELDLSDWDTRSVTDLYVTFKECTNLTKLDLSNWDTSNVTTMNNMFMSCNNLEELNLSGWDFRKYNTRWWKSNVSLGSLSLKKLNMTNAKFSGSMEQAFEYNCSMEELVLDGVDTSNVTSMHSMFNGCRNLRELNLSSFDTSNVEDMGYMFYYCSGLTQLDISHFDTSKVTNMYDMFYNCKSLTSLNLSSFNTSNVTNMRDMFGACSSLETIFASTGFTTNKISNNSMFYNDINLVGGNGTKYDSSKTYETYAKIDKVGQKGYFTNIDSIIVKFMVGKKEYGRQAVPFGGKAMQPANNPVKTGAEFLGWTTKDGEEYDFDTKIERYTEIYAKFSGWNETILLPGIEFNQILKKLSGQTDAAYNMQNTGITKILQWTGDIPLGVTTGRISTIDSANEVVAWYDDGDIYYHTDADRIYLNEDSSYMFNYMTALTEIGMDNWDTSNVENMEGMFCDCRALTGINMDNWDTSSVTNMFNMFYGCKSLINLDLSNFNTSNATNIGNMFNGCNSLKNLNVSNRDTSNVSSSLGGIFQGCSNLETLKMDGWDFRTIGIPSGMLGGTTSLKYISMSGWKIPENFTNGLSRSWGGGNSPIEEIDVTNWDLSQTRDAQGLFADSRSLKTIKGLNTWDTSGVTIMNSMFQNCFNLTGLDLSSWDTSNVTSMYTMFNNCSKLTTLDLSNFDTSNVTNMSSMFAGSTNLEYLNLSGWDFTHLFYGFGMGTLAGGQTLLKYLNLSNAKFTGNISYGFNYVKIGEVNLNGADVSNVTNMTSLFAGNDTLTKIGLEGWDTSNVGYMGYMFLNCSGLTELDLSSFDTSNVKNMDSMFLYTPNLKTIYVSDKFVTSGLIGGYYSSGTRMFYGDINLVGGNGTKFDSGYTDKTYAKIDKVGQTGYFTDKNAINVKFISTLDGTETTSTFAKGQKLTPPSVNGYHAVGGYLDEAMTQKIDLNKGVDSYSEIYVKYERNGSSGGGGGGGGGTTKPDTPKEEQKPADTSEQVPQNDNSASSGANVKIPENETQMDSQIGEQSSAEQSEGQGNGRSNTSDNSYTNEQKEAYEFAKENGITTMTTIQKADMSGKLTRIQMAKMLSQYAINVLGQTPDTSKTAKFKDVTAKRDADYDNGVTLAYQLGIMGQNMKDNKFRPNDEVSRAEFVTALSRLLYSTSDGEYKSTSKYYIHHMEKLVKEGIITNDDPKMKERRGYVMIMLMRSAK